MTAEIAIMNKNAVALAADSAVTIGSGDKEKIYNTNKLFMLSKFHPIGVMVYGNAELLGMPWETTVKSYRAKLGDTSFETLEEYGANFLTFLEGNRILFPESEQDNWAHGQIYQALGYIRGEIDNSVEKYTHAHGRISDDELKKIIRTHVEDYRNRVLQRDDSPLVSPAVRRKIEKRFAEFVRRIISQLFQKLPLTSTQRSHLRDFCFNVLFKHTGISGESGLVIAGFGEKEFFPAVAQYQIDGIVSNRLKYKLAGKENVGTHERAIVAPFAQTEMVHTFMQGINPSLQSTLNKFLGELLTAIYPEQITSVIGGSKPQQSKLKKELSTVGEELMKEFLSSFEKQKRIENIDPVVEAVAFLPKEELASMAESLVNLTSFKRRVTLVAETVGGPIDVAVISKGDGFVWVKRKHYFDHQMNPQFHKNYYR